MIQPEGEHYYMCLLFKGYLKQRIFETILRLKLMLNAMKPKWNDEVKQYKRALEQHFIPKRKPWITSGHL